jgi:hypothetical protein
MIAGRRAFAAASPVETMTAILNADPPAFSALGLHAPQALQRVIERCLESGRSGGFSRPAISRSRSSRRRDPHRVSRPLESSGDPPAFRDHGKPPSSSRSWPRLSRQAGG